MRLTQRVFIEDFDVMDTFGMHHQQLNRDTISLFQVAGWYNQFGQFLGWGNLSERDFNTLARLLEGNEVFLVVTQVDRPNHEDDVDCDFVAQFASIVVYAGHIAFVEDDTQEIRTYRKMKQVGSLEAPVICRTELHSLLNTARTNSSGDLSKVLI